MGCSSAGQVLFVFLRMVREMIERLLAWCKTRPEFRRFGLLFLLHEMAPSIEAHQVDVEQMHHGRHSKHTIMSNSNRITSFILILKNDIRYQSFN